MAAQSGGVTPLYVASQNGHVEAVRALLDAGAAVNQAKVCAGLRSGAGWMHAKRGWLDASVGVSQAGREWSSACEVRVCFVD